MFKVLEPYILSFIAIFIAAGTLGNIPYFLSLTEGMDKAQKRKVIRDSVLVAAVLALIFLFIGKFLLKVLGISVSDFKIAGGLLLMYLSVYLLSPGTERRAMASNDVGIFPLGTPLITGPAVLTMTIMMADYHGVLPTLVALVLNMVIVWVIFSFTDILARLLGVGMMRAFSKVSDILLAAIAVMMIRNGVFDYINLMAGR